jgi:hypothetical protein
MTTILILGVASNAFMIAKRFMPLGYSLYEYYAGHCPFYELCLTGAVVRELVLLLSSDATLLSVSVSSDAALLSLPFSVYLKAEACNY